MVFKAIINKYMSLFQTVDPRSVSTKNANLLILLTKLTKIKSLSGWDSMLPKMPNKRVIKQKNYEFLTIKV